MASIQQLGNGQAKITTGVGSYAYPGGNIQFQVGTTANVSAQGVVQPVNADGSVQLSVDRVSPGGNPINLGNINVAQNGSTNFTAGAGFSNLPTALQTGATAISGQNFTNISKDLVKGAIGDLGLTDKTPIAANAAAAGAAAGGIAGAVAAAPAAPSPGSQSASAGGLRYPFDMDGRMDYVLFTCPEEGSYPGPVSMGIQPQISDSNAVEWGGSTLNQLQKEIVNFGMKELLDPKKNWEEILKNLPGRISKIAKENYSGGEEAGKMVKLWMMEQAMGLQGLSARSDVGVGAILNPNLELVFTSPTLRPFTFTFRMTSRHPKESESIKKIIRFFKQNMAPRKKGTFVLKRPPYFEIEYKGKAADNGFLNKIGGKTKQCALTNCSVDYTPDGSYMTYTNDGAMTAYNLTLQFQEIAPLYDEDYKELSPNIIGY